ncbi:MAG: sensor histidine kinase [Lachnospiraceae bacterium]|nr:sensor histidine kinase [Lachnospiraceae bacterium]
MKKLKALLKKLSWKNMKLRGQMYMVYVLALIVPLAIVGVVLIVNAYRLLNDYYMDLLKSDNLRVRSLLSQITTQAYNVSDDICFDSAQKTLLSGTYASPVDFVHEANNSSKIDDIVFNYQEIQGIYIYTDNPTIVNYKQYNKVTEDIKETEWYKRALGQTSAFWTLIEEKNFGNTTSYLALVRRMLLPNSDYEAVVVIKLGDAYIRSKINSKIVDAIAVDNAGIVYSSKSSWYKEQLPIEVDYSDAYYNYSGVVEVEDTNYFAVVSTTSPHMTNSKLYICTMDDNVYYEIQAIINGCILILALAVLIPGIVLFWYANKFTKRVYLLREEMHKASHRNYDMSVKFTGHDELTDAYEDLKLMVSDIKEKDAKMYEAEINEKELRNNQQLMEYKMLAGQINPHYLYNTLETIRMKSLSAGNREVADCIKILGKTLQYVLKNTGTTVTTLSKELEHVENYLAIQKMRFGDRINYTLDIEEGLDTEEFQILPLLLQPIVENAVIHGLEHIDSNGHIDIKVYRNSKEQLKIIVSDNGKGMKPEEYEEVCKKLNTPGLKLESSIGVYNICERIRLHYGEEYGLQIESEYGQGTKVILVLPA